MRGWVHNSGMELKKTSLDHGHYHFVYLRDDNTGYCSRAADGHVHDVKFTAAIPSIADPDTGEMLQDEVPAKFELLPASNHTHNILLQSEENFLDADPEEDDEAKVKMCWALFKSAKEKESVFRKNAYESFDMYMGKQWDEADRAKLKSEDRACLTINEIESKIDVLVGYQRQNRYDITYLPVEGGDSKIADVFTFVAKNVLEQNNFDYEETETFEDGAITGRGLMTVYVDTTRFLEGEIRTETLPWDSVYFGEHQKKDGSDAEYLVKASWHSLQKLKELYPDYAEKFTEQKLVEFIGTSDAGRDFKAENYNHPDAKSNVYALAKNEFVDLVNKQYLVIEVQKKRYRRIPIIMNVVDGYIYDGQFLKSADVKSIRTIPGMNVIEKVACEMQILKVAKDLLLGEDYSEDDTFDTIPFYAKKKGEFVWGKVEGVKDIQREVNKRHSQMVDIMNKVATYGFYYDSETFPDKAEEMKFKKNAAKPGFVQKVRSLDRRPAREDGVRFPGELAQLEQLSSAKIREIMNVNEQMMGLNAGQESGVAIAEKRRQGLIGNEFLFDNFSLTRRMLGRRLFRKIQEVYSPKRILRLIQDKVAQGANVQIGGRPAGEYNELELTEMLGTVDADKYDVVVAESAFSPTKRTANFVVWADMMKQGFPLPPDILIELSDLPGKEKIIAKIQEQQQQAAQLEQDKMNTELQKTMIAKGGQSGAQ